VLLEGHPIQRAYGTYARIVDQHVQGAKPVRDRRHGPVPFIRPGDIKRLEAGPVAQIGRQGPPFFVPYVAYRNPGALLGKESGLGFALASGPARDEGHLVVQPRTHSTPLRTLVRLMLPADSCTGSKGENIRRFASGRAAVWSAFDGSEGGRVQPIKIGWLGLRS
jgi:hypothetical protein